MRAYIRLGGLAVLIGLATSVTGCEDLTGLNENPNAPTDVSAEFLLPEAIRTGVSTAYGSGMMLSHTGIFPQHAVEIQYAEEEIGGVRSQTMNSFWDNYYVGPLQDIQGVIDKGRETNTPNHEAVGLIWRSWVFHQVTDLWGDIPYSEALGGRDNTVPVYDSQQQVYTGLLNDLTEAVALLDDDGDGFGTGDILYGDDMEAWRRFANSLRMRLAMRLVNVDPATAQAEFVAAYNAGVFESNADNAALEWPGAPYENPLYTNYLGRDDHGISGTLVDTLANLTDPRLQLYAEPAQIGGGYVGHDNGWEDPPLPIGNYSRIGNFWRRDGASTPSMIMSYAEVLFLEAEAAQRGWIPGNVGALYVDAITANMNQYDDYAPANAPTDAEITAYLANPLIVYNPLRGLEQIHLQQWIAFFMNGGEAWSHWRRTDTPSLTPGPDLLLSRIPVRFSYPTNEESYNLPNLDAAVARQGGGKDLVTPLWWMDE
jgi:hypothetical protein